MDSHDQPGLFDVPDREPSTPPTRSARGRNRETWTRTATAEVTITDAEAIHAAVVRAEDQAVTIRLDPSPPEEDTAVTGPAGGAGTDAFDALVWLVWPTDGLEALLDVGAVEVLSLDCEVEPDSIDRGRLTWTVTVKLRDVQELRRIAVQARPSQAGEVAEDLALAWQQAADPFAPLRAIPGITWQPGRVEVHHVPAGRRGSPDAT